MTTGLVYVHPTKTGGTTVEHFLKKGVSPSAVRTGGGHTTRVDDALDSGCLVVIRDPIERAMSIYRYYRAGSERYNPHHRRPVLSFDAFWTAIDAGCDPGLPRLYMWEDHLRPQTWWIRTEHLDDPRVHVILNHPSTSLKQATFDTLRSLGIDHDPAMWTDVNVSRYRDDISLLPSTERLLRRLFADDLELWATAQKKMLPNCTTNDEPIRTNQQQQAHETDHKHEKT